MQVPVKSDFSEIVAYNIPDFPFYVRRGLLSNYPDYAAISHWHDDLEFIRVLSGSMQYNINGSVVTLEEGDGIFVNSRQLHYGFSDIHQECDFFCFLFHPMLLCSSSYVEETFVIPILSNLAFPFCLLKKDIPWQKEILDILDMIHPKTEEPAFALHAQKHAFSIWEILYQNIPKNAAASPSHYHQFSILKNMVGFIQKNYSQKITLADIAASGNVCKSSCGNIFREYLNQTPIAYPNYYRLLKSIDLMGRSDLTLAQISYLVGFSGASYYTETFHQQFGCSPSEYRSLHLKKQI